MGEGPVRLSVVIPAYNEAARLPRSLAQVTGYLAAQSYAAEIIVVDDGSSDGTVAAARRAAPVATVLSYAPNRGKGYAVKTGMLAARGAYRLFYDADASTPIHEIEKVWPAFDAGADAVIGSRALPESNVQVHQRWYRENMGRVFNRVVRILGLTEFPDTQCGFKAFTARACGVIFPRQTIHRFSFDVELLFIARMHGLRVAQVPVQWLNCPDTRVRAVRDSARMLHDVARVRVNHLRGRYA